jgi:hypothetical protein
VNVTNINAGHPNWQSQVVEQPVIIRVGANPKPNDGVAVQCTHGTMNDADAGRLDWWVGMHFLEAQARMRRILAKQLVGLPRLRTHLNGKLRE